MMQPRTLFGRLVLILLAGLASAQLLTLAFVVVERGMVSRGMMVSYVAADVASSVAMLDRLPVSERAAWLPKLERSNYRFVLGTQPGAAAFDKPDALTQSVVDALTAALAKPVAAVEVQEPGVATRLSLQLADGSPLQVDLASPKMRLSPWLLGLLGGESETVLTRPSALRRAVGNLVDNAVKFGGVAEVLLTVRDGRACIVVQDRGSGIPEHALDKVLLPFYRLEASRNAETGGTGLGLAIVQRLVRHCHAALLLGPREGGGLSASIHFN